jgi:hypothetical protein
MAQAPEKNKPSTSGATGPTGATGPRGPHAAIEAVGMPLVQYETMLQDILQDGSEAPASVMLAGFRSLVWDAYHRNVIDDVLQEVLVHAFDMHVTMTKLDDAVELRKKLLKAGQETPNLNKSITGLVQTIKAHRAWATSYLDKVKQCPLPGTPIH